MRRGHWLLLLTLLLLGSGWLWLRPGTRAKFTNLPPTASGEWVAFGDTRMSRRSLKMPVESQHAATPLK